MPLSLAAPLPRLPVRMGRAPIVGAEEFAAVVMPGIKKQILNDLNQALEPTGEDGEEAERIEADPRKSGIGAAIEEGEAEETG